MRFQEKKVLVSGAGHGIGLAISRAFIDEGARVAINDIDSDRVAEALETIGNTSYGFPGDVADAQEARAVVSKAGLELGGLDIVVSNAGIYPSHPFLEMDVNDWDRVMAVNIRGTFLICQAAAQLMVQKKQEGVIITISSGSARFARVGSAHYCASKAAVVMLTQVMALELAPHRIRVNSVSPGIIDVPGGQPLSESYKQAMARMVPWGRMGRPEDVANVVLLVSDPKAEYMTGQVIPVDGGLSSGRYGIPVSGE
ncbi:MAG: SDR family oxidoreductase [Desulfobacterales bacterium]|nr:MAG: SDR family oxidoreductase [Desulfobacterales bacterium]